MKEVFYLNQVFTFILMLILVIAAFFLFEILDQQFDIKIRYFSFVAKKRWLFYVAFSMWLILSAVLFIIIDRWNNSLHFILLILYYCIFVSLYHNVRNWQMAYNVYIKHIDLLRKAKEREKKKRKKGRFWK